MVLMKGFCFIKVFEMDQPMNTKDPLHVPSGPIIRFKAQALKEA
jgi:hypothetical protein